MSISENGEVVWTSQRKTAATMTAIWPLGIFGRPTNAQGRACDYPRLRPQNLRGRRARPRLFPRREKRRRRPSRLQDGNLPLRHSLQRLRHVRHRRRHPDDRRRPLRRIGWHERDQSRRRRVAAPQDRGRFRDDRNRSGRRQRLPAAHLRRGLRWQQASHFHLCQRFQEHRHCGGRRLECGVHGIAGEFRPAQGDHRQPCASQCLHDRRDDQLVRIRIDRRRFDEMRHTPSRALRQHEQRRRLRVQQACQGKGLRLQDLVRRRSRTRPCAALHQWRRWFRGSRIRRLLHVRRSDRERECPDRTCRPWRG